jgi:hypothetical protein
MAAGRRAASSPAERLRTFKVNDLGERFASQYVALKKEHTFHSMLEAYQMAVGHAGLRKELEKTDILIANYGYAAPLIRHVPVIASP